VRAMPMEPAEKRQCSLLLFVATSSEEKALKDAAQSRQLTFERIRDNALGEYYWMGKIGNERVIAVRAKGMGPLGRGGSADLAFRFGQATGANAIVQVGMAFGISPRHQRYGDVLVSSSLIPYDNRDVRPAQPPYDSLRGLRKAGHSVLTFLASCIGIPAVEATRYTVDYRRADRRPASSVLVTLFQREQRRGGHSFGVHVGALLSGAARIHARAFRDELAQLVPAGDDPIIGGEMEATGLLGAADEPIWCVVKGIVDFADEDRDAVFEQNRPIACRNAAEFVLSALVNDVPR
jgi:nucleoside phosphorylase